MNPARLWRLIVGDGTRPMPGCTASGETLETVANDQRRQSRRNPRVTAGNGAECPSLAPRERIPNARETVASRDARDSLTDYDVVFLFTNRQWRRE